MRKLFAILLLMSASLCALAQTDYVAQAQVNIKKYYPQYEEYFKPIFERFNKLSPSSKALFNRGVQENMELFDEDIESEKDKCAIVLMTLEVVMTNKTEFTKAKDVQGAKGDSDYKFEIAEEMINDINTQARKDAEEARKETARIKAHTAKLNEIISLIKSLDAQGINKNGMEQITKEIEEYFTLFNDEELRSDLEQNKGIAKIIRHYINYNKQIGRTPSPLGQKFINEYNKYQK